MLNNIVKANPALVKRCISGFGGSHGAPVHIDINKEATWLKFKTSRRLQCVDGIQDTHIPLPDFFKDDPYAHIRGKPWYHEDVFFNSEEYHHSLDHEPNATGLQGYAHADDPNDSRFDLIVPTILSLAVVIGAFALREYGDINVQKPLAEKILDADNIEQLVEERLREKTRRLKELQEN